MRCKGCQGSLVPGESISTNDGGLGFCSVECAEKAAKEAAPIVPLHCLACGMVVSAWSSDLEEPPLCLACSGEALKIGTWPHFVMQHVRYWATADPDILSQASRAERADEVRELAALRKCAEALHLVECGFRLAERSTPANLRRTIIDSRRALSELDAITKEAKP